MAPSREDTYVDGAGVNERRSLPSNELPSESSNVLHRSIYGEELVRCRCDGQYGALGRRTGQDVVDTPVDLIPLRANIYHLYDQRDFSIVPRRRQDEGSTRATYVIKQDAELLELYQNVEMQSLTGILPEFLLAPRLWTSSRHCSRSFKAAGREYWPSTVVTERSKLGSTIHMNAGSSPRVNVPEEVRVRRRDCGRTLLWISRRPVENHLCVGGRARLGRAASTPR